MEYIEEAEKILKYFDFNMTKENLSLLYDIKRLLNFDMCLFGSFIKDYLVIKNNFNEISDDIYNEFIVFLDDKNQIEALEEIKAYAQIYRMIVFETAEDRCTLWGISTVNSCYKIEFYPILTHILYMYYNLKIDSQRFNMMLQSLVDITIKCFANPDLRYSLKQINQTVIENSISSERHAS